MAIVSSNPTSNTALTLSDFSQLGTTEWSDQKDLTGMGTGQYVNFVYNATGRAQLTADGSYRILKTGLREGHDITNNSVPYTTEKQSGIWNAYYADQSGTTQDPKLVIEHTAPPSAPTDLLTEGQTNPTNVADPTPEFSAVFQDPDAGDYATDYQIQVSTSSSQWSPLMWDSGRTALTGQHHGRTAQ